MKGKTVITFMVALSLAAGSTFFASKWLEHSKSNMRLNDTTTNTDPELSPVVVAAIKIQQFSKIEPANVKLAMWPKVSIPGGALTEVNAVSGKFAAQTIQPNEVVTSERLADSGRLASIIQHGKRAVSMRVNDVSGVSGYVLPGTYVDVIVAHKECKTQTTYNSNGSVSSGHNYRFRSRDESSDYNSSEEKVSQDKCKKTSKLALSNIKVLAVDQYSSTDGVDPKVVKAVTLELTPEESQVLVAEGVGNDDKSEVRLALRNNGLDEHGSVRDSRKDPPKELVIYRNGNHFSDTKLAASYKPYELKGNFSIIGGRDPETQETIDARYKQFMVALAGLQKASGTNLELESQDIDNRKSEAELHGKEMMVECMWQHFSETNGYSLGQNICSQRVYGTYLVGVPDSTRY